jgi:hypothetical protein
MRPLTFRIDRHSRPTAAVGGPSRMFPQADIRCDCEGYRSQMTAKRTELPFENYLMVRSASQSTNSNCRNLLNRSCFVCCRQKPITDCLGQG